MKSILNNKKLLENLVKENYTYSDILIAAGLKLTGGNQRTLKKYIELFNLDISHFNQYIKNIPKKTEYRKEIFVENSNCGNKKIINEIIKYGLIKYECAREVCKNIGFWHGQPLTLQLEHKNGDNKDNRIENLEFLCPNCHTQTLTYGSKNRKSFTNKTNTKKIKPLIDFEFNKILFKIESGEVNNINEIFTIFNIRYSRENYKYLLEKLKSINNKEIISFIEKHSKNDNKIIYPNPLELLKLIEEKGFKQIAKEMNCSDTSLRKFLKSHGLKTIDKNKNIK